MTVSLDIFEKALIYAINKHSGQIRKGNSMPYICHPFSVMQKIFNNKESKNIYLLATASVLHDVAEDCFEDSKEGLKEIENLFGIQVASIVSELTIDKEQSKILGKKEYLVQKMNGMSTYALAIKLCDRLDNCSDLNMMDDKFRKYYTNQTRYILSKLDRHLTATHIKLINDINNMLNSYN